MTFENKNILLEISKQEINKFKETKAIISSNKRDIGLIEHLLSIDEFEMVKQSYNYPPPYYLLKGFIRHYLDLWYEENKDNWIGTIKQFNNPIILISLNHLYDRENYKIFIKQIKNSDNKLLKSLFINTNGVIKFTNDYFDKYYCYWLKNPIARKKHIFEQWYKIFDRFADFK